jgi:uncharacterized protein DUF3551
MQKILLRGAIAAAVLLPASTAVAYEGPWCLRGTVAKGVGERCDYRTFEACRDERSLYGGTASCTQNPGYLPYWQNRGFDQQPRQKVSHKKKRSPN